MKSLSCTAMSSRIALLSLAFMSLNAFADPYDGIWTRSGDPVGRYRMHYGTGTLSVGVTVTQVGTAFVGDWNGTSIGTLSGNTVTFTFENSGATGTGVTTYSSPNSGQVIYLTCTLKPAAASSSCPNLNVPYTLTRLY